MSKFKIVQRIKEKSSQMYRNKTVTVAFLGDSVTQGCYEIYRNGEQSVETYFDTPSSYSSKLKTIFQTVFPNVPFNVINSGISGGSAPNGLERLERDVLCFNPDLAVICFGLNDCGGGRENIVKYTSALRGIFKKLKEKDIDAIFMTPNMMNTYVFPEIKDDFITALSENFAKIQNEGVLDDYVAAAIKTAQEEGVAVSDVYAKWKKLFKSGADVTMLLANYLNHPTRDMHWLFAASLFETIMFED